MIEEKDPELKGFFDMFYESMNPLSKKFNTRYSLRRKVMVLCYQIAGLRNKHVNSTKKEIALYMTNPSSLASGINTLSNLGFTTTFKTVTREKAKIVKDHEKNLLEYLSDKVWNL